MQPPVDRLRSLQSYPNTAAYQDSTSQLHQLSESIHTLQEMLQERENTALTLREELEHCTSRVAQLEALVEDKERTLCHVQEEFAQLRLHFEQKCNACEALQHQLEVMDSERTQRQRLIENWKREMERRTEERHHVDLMLEESQMSLETAARTNETLTQFVCELQRELDSEDVMSEIRRLKDVARVSEAQQIDLDAALVALEETQRDQAALLAKNRTLQSTESELVEQLNERQCELDAALDEVEDLRSREHMLQQQCNNQSTILRSLKTAQRKPHRRSLQSPPSSTGKNSLRVGRGYRVAAWLCRVMYYRDLVRSYFVAWSEWQWSKRIHGAHLPCRIRHDAQQHADTSLATWSKYNKNTPPEPHTKHTLSREIEIQRLSNAVHDLMSQKAKSTRREHRNTVIHSPLALRDVNRSAWESETQSSLENRRISPSRRPPHRSPVREHRRKHLQHSAPTHFASY